MILSFLGKYREGGLLLLRAGIGLLFMVHGLLMMSGSGHWYNWHNIVAHWHDIGAAGMQPVGMNSYLPFWGALAFFSEFIGGIFLALGFCFRPACLFLAITMTMATIMHWKHHDPFNKSLSHAAEMAVVFYSLLLIGPGTYSIDKS